eukprot:CAMPEP_0174921934 /NCGR_PEP_ID=MMETSP1355-20121228/5505_1 /TAXON_ID=464990 /ORGANISM="Hemiselmis tepida, Strain CCMP443" /LENGTH=213 /DNA_ID=CAMNT_0016167465 /DNA_START=195 /DNA_END=836 /DNA_ORIENTATION=-
MGSIQSSLESGGEQHLGPLPEPSEDGDIALVADAIAKRVQCVAFDMDQCLVAQHSRGRLSKKNLGGFLSRVTPDFVKLVPELHRRGVKLAVCTHSDKAEYNAVIRPETHVLGEDLVGEVLRASVPEQAAHFFVFAYNPNVRYHILLPLFPHKIGKKKHIRECVRHYGLEGPGNVLLFDDDDVNVRVTEGCLALKVDPATGFTVRALRDKILAL